MNRWITVDVDGFAAMFGVDHLPPECVALVQKYDFAYRAVTAAEEQSLVDDVTERIQSKGFTRAGPDGKGRWDKGWGENLDRFQTTSDVSALVPAYIRCSPIIRLHGTYMMARDPRFEAHWFEVFQAWIFR